MPGWSVDTHCKKVGRNVTVHITQNFNIDDMPNLIVRYNRDGIAAICQLFQGSLCVAKGTSILGKEQALKNAYRNYFRSKKIH